MEAFRAIFAVLDDPRGQNTCHELHEVLFLAFAAVLCGAKNCVEIAEFGRAKLPLLRSFLTLKHGAPSHDTISRLFRLLDPKAFASCFARFAETFHAQLVREGHGRRVVAIDGKRRAYDKGCAHMPAMMVSAWGVETRLTLAHTIAPAGNEVEGALRLLEMISLKGCIVTGDSLHCNRKMAARLRELKADDVLALKGNPFDLTREARALLDAAAEAAGTPYAESRESGHGRIERRRAIVVPAKALGEKRKFPGLAAVARVEDWREEDGKAVHRTRLFALSRGFSPRRVLQIVRGHWSIENQCHWLLDVVFHEDLARNRKDHSPENLSILRRMTMNVLRAIPTKASIAVKRKQAAWSEDAFFNAMTYLR